MSKIELAAELRSDVGKGASRRLRRLNDKIPAVIYGGDQEAVSLSFEHRKILKAFENEAIYSSVLTINIDGKKEQAVLKALQRHPYKPKFLHLDLLRVSANEPITMNVPLHFLGQEECPGVKAGGIVSHHITDIEISCLPQDLPAHIDVDLSQAELNQTFHLSDIQLPANVEMTADISNADHNHPIASIHLPKKVEEEVPEETEVQAEGTGEEVDTTPEEGKTDEDKSS